MDELAEERLVIGVRAWLDNDLLCFEVKDDGIGIPSEKLATLLTSPTGSSGIGLKNVHERIQLTYGQQSGLTIHSQEDTGTTVTIRLPAHQEVTA